MRHAFLIALMLSAPIAANATTIVDGGFEAKGAATPVADYCYDGFATGGGPACAASPWVGGGVIISGSAAWGGSLSPSGSYHGFVQGTSTLSQSFTATENGSAVITWLAANRQNFGGTQTYSVSIFDGASTTNFGSFTNSSGTFLGQTTSSFAITNGTNYTLSFTGIPAGDNTAFIDNVAVAVTTSAVPEPSTWALLLAGFGLIGFSARRRRAAVAA